jgi:hypothetical protein
VARVPNAPASASRKKKKKKKKKSFRKAIHSGPTHGTPIGHRTAHPWQRTWDPPRANKTLLILGGFAFLIFHFSRAGARPLISRPTCKLEC